MPATIDDRLLGGRYRLGEPLGRGGMGVVWAGRDEALGRDVAIKEVVLPPELSGDERDRLRRRTIREARAAARISSPTAVSVYDVVEEDGRPWIVMELLTARSLADVLREDGVLPANRAAEVGLDILDALEAAAAVGVLHRDVKPANVMLRPTGQAILTDFGIATVEGDATVTTTGLVLGSPAYMSPERARGESSTLTSDLWSLGATLYAAVDGRSPFERSGTLPTLNAILHDPAPVLAHGGQLGEVVNSLLAKEPASRPTIGEVRAALLHIVARKETPLLALGGVARHKPRPTSTRGPRDAPVTQTSSISDGSEDGAIQSWLDEPDDRTRTTRRVIPRSLPIVGLLIAVAFIGLGVFLDDWRSPSSDATRAESEQGAGSQPTAVVRSQQPTTEVGVNPRAAGAPISVDRPETTPWPSTPSTAPSETAESSPPAASEPPAGPHLPAGFRLHTDPTGFTVAVPEGWTRSTEGPRTYFNDSGSGRFLLVDQTTEPKDDPLTDWQANEPSVANRLSGYERISLKRVEYRGWETADWEFTWQGRNGQIHVLNRNIRVSDERAYALYWSIPEGQWADSRPMFDVIAQSFQPAPD
ncbi:MAG TPA: protein kinase [Jiangellaceae bacterium]|nr:protein kinase [Jiangellaceae bacterium]